MQDTIGITTLSGDTVTDVENGLKLYYFNYKMSLELIQIS